MVLVQEPCQERQLSSKVRADRSAGDPRLTCLGTSSQENTWQFDSENKNSKWYDAIKLEMESMLEYKVF